MSGTKDREKGTVRNTHLKSLKDLDDSGMMQSPRLAKGIAGDG